MSYRLFLAMARSFVGLSCITLFSKCSVMLTVDCMFVVCHFALEVFTFLILLNFCFFIVPLVHVSLTVFVVATKLSSYVFYVTHWNVSLRNHIRRYLDLLDHNELSL